MRKPIASVLAASLACSLCAAPAFAVPTVVGESGTQLTQTSGRLLISEAGTYTLTGNLRGTVYVDPGIGDVTLIMDNVAIDGDQGPAIVAASGDSLTVKVPAGTDSRVNADGGVGCKAAIISSIDMSFEGTGRLTVVGDDESAIRVENAGVSFNGGDYEIVTKGHGVEMIGDRAGKVTVNGGSLLFRVGGRSITPANAAVFNGGDICEAGLVSDYSYEDFLAEWSAIMSPDDLGVPSDMAAANGQGANSGSQVGRMGVPERMEFQPGEPGQQSESGQPGESGQTGLPGQQGQQPGMPAGQFDQQQGQQFEDPVDQQAQMPGQPQWQTPDEQGQMPSEQGQMPSEQGQMPGLRGQMPESMSGEPGNQGQPGQPGQFGQQTLEGTVVEAGEIVEGTTTNSAASLEADMDAATYYTVSDENSQVKITESGTYVVTGTASDGNITVKKGTTGVVLILDNLDLTSTTGATVSVNKEAEVKIVISGDVVLTDAEDSADEESTDEAVADAFDGAALKAKANSQVYLTGDGTLTINGTAKNGIKAGDDSSLVIDGVTINITAANDGINANYDLAILSGEVTIEAVDDAIHADHILTVGAEEGVGPKISVTNCTEGLEATVVNIMGGDVSIKSSDDAINAANKDGVYEGVLGYSVNVIGGMIDIVSSGDGIDSNGNVNLIGGKASISSATVGGEAGIDYDGDLYVSDAFNLNNSSGVAGSDGAPGQMGEQPDQMGGQPGQMPTGDWGQAPQGGQPGQMPTGDWGQAPQGGGSDSFQQFGSWSNGWQTGPFSW